jgi:hypothetical protein
MGTLRQPDLYVSFLNVFMEIKTKAPIIIAFSFAFLMSIDG